MSGLGIGLALFAAFLLGGRVGFALARRFGPARRDP
jgi:hypothetical protein